MFGTSNNSSGSSSSEGSWFLDSGATHHFTPDISMLDNPMPVLGDDQDIHTKKTLFQGHLEDGLYKLFPSASSKSFTSPSSSSTPSVNSPFPAPVQVYHTQLQDVNLWHNRLGHPSFPIFSKVMKLCILKTSNKSSPEFLCSSSNGQEQSFAVCQF